jgi:2'-5' RNA ligase
MSKLYKVDNEFTVAHFMADVRTGQEIDSWPPHITLLAPFLDREYRAMAGFMETVEDTEAIKAHFGIRQLGAVALFGNENDIQVRPIVGEGAVALGVMHGLLLARFHGKIIDPRFSGGNYRPHTTIVPGYPDPGEGAELSVDSMCLVRDGGEQPDVIVAAEKLR